MNSKKREDGVESTMVLLEVEGNLLPFVKPGKNPTREGS